MIDHFLAEPAVHAGLLVRGATDEYRETWRATGAVRLERALEAGLAARVATVGSQFPLEAAATDDEIVWTVRVHMPPDGGLNYPASLYRIVRLLRDDLPPLATAIVGEECRVADPFALTMVSLRTGSYVDASGDGLHALIWITAPEWPAEWGGQLEILDAQGVVTAQLPPRAGAIDLVTAGRYRISLIERDVACFAFRQVLARVEAA